MKIKKDKDEIGIIITGIVWIAIHIGLIYLIFYSIITGEHIKRTSFLVLGYALIDATVYKTAEFLSKDNSKSKEDNSSVSVVKSSKKSKSEKKIHLLKNAAVDLSEDLLIGQQKEITCPICGHPAIIGKSPHNGYLYGQCNKCSMGFIEKRSTENE